MYVDAAIRSVMQTQSRTKPMAVLVILAQRLAIACEVLELERWIQFKAAWQVDAEVEQNARMPAIVANPELVGQLHSFALLVVNPRKAGAQVSVPAVVPQIRIVGAEREVGPGARL